MTPLGTFFWYSIPQKMISLETARRAWRQGGLDVRYLPESRKPADVAAEACTLISRSIFAASSSFTQVENTSDRLLYRVEEHDETHDPATGEPGMGSIVSELVFEKATASFSSLNQPLLRQVRGVYEQNSSRLPAHKQRQALRAFLLDAGGENLHGSIYFMPHNALVPHGKEAGPTEGRLLLDAAWRTVFALYGDAAEFHRVPVEDDGLQVSYVKQAMDRLLAGEIEDLRYEVRTMLETERGRKWRSDRVDTIVNRRRALLVRADRFAQLLGEPLPHARAEDPVRVEMENAVADLVSLTEAPVIA